MKLPIKINKLLPFSFQFSLFIVVGSIVPQFAHAATLNIKDSNIQQMLGVAQAKVDAENNVLISGDNTKLTQSTDQLNGVAAESLSEVANVQVRRNKILADHGQHYTKAISKFTIQKNDVSGNTATITAFEYTKLTLVNDNSTDQITTEEGKTHELHFTRQGNIWSLTEDKIIDNLGPIAPLGGEQKITAPVLSLDITKKHPEPSRIRSGNVSSDGVTTFTVTHGTFNPSNAVNYANNYWGRDQNSNNTAGYNPAYRVYYDQNSGNLADCTNFVSQAMNWGGWQHIGGWYSDANNWWYDPALPWELAWGNKGESFTWINAHYFYFFARYAARVSNAATLSDFRPGDVLQIDFGTPNGILDHTEIVTTKDSNGNIYLTSHAVNVHNKSFWDIYAQNPGANYYGSLMYYQY